VTVFLQGAEPSQLWNIVSALANCFTGAIAALALFFAARASKAARDTNTAQQQTLRLQREQFEILKSETASAQASKINYWWVANNLITVMNASDAPVFHANYINTKTEPCHDRIEVLSPSGNKRTDIFIDRSLNEEEAWDAFLFFNDATGRRWIRDHTGRLKPASGVDILKEIASLRKMGSSTKTEIMRITASLAYVEDIESLTHGRRRYGQSENSNPESEDRARSRLGYLVSRFVDLPRQNGRSNRP